MQKYGEPSYVNKDDTAIWAAWKFSSVDAPAEKLKSSLSCIGTSDSPVGLNDHTAGKAKKSASFCGLYIEFTVRGDQIGLANELDMGMMNHRDLVRDFETDTGSDGPSMVVLSLYVKIKFEGSSYGIYRLSPAM